MQEEPTIPMDPERAADFARVEPREGEARLHANVKAFVSDDPEELQRHLPQYRIGELLGRGGMGNVIEVDDPKLARTVALKVMKLGPDATEEQRGRFVREATVLARLAHPNIVPIYDLGADDAGSPFYTMKLVKGRTLLAILKDLRDGAPDTLKLHTLDRLLGVFRKVCDAVAFAHSKGVLHRDLKPENIMVGEFGEVLVMDWGLAKFLHGEQEAWNGDALGQSMMEQSRVSIGPSTLGATLDGALMGTPQYMSPEQAEGKTAELDERSDIFSLGAILYAILTLRPPVDGKTVAEVLMKISHGQIDPPSAFGFKSESQGAPSTKGEPLDARAFRPLPHCPGGRVPPALSAVTMKALSVDKAGRYQAVSEFSAEIEAWQTGFATQAENAGLGRQVVLLIRRHKGVFTTAFAAWLIITALAAWFVFNVTRAKQQAEIERNRATANEARAVKNEERAQVERDRAERNLAELRATAPTFFEQARLLTGQAKLSEALQKIDIAVQLNPADAGYHVQRGHILQSMERFPEAAEAYTAALRLKPGFGIAQANIDLSRSLAAAKEKDGALSINTRMKWRDALTLQDRGAEAILAGRGTAADAEKMLPAWQGKLDAWLGRNAPRLHVKNGFYEIDLSNQSLTDISPLRGMPLQKLTINDNPHLKDLSPLADCPLVELYANIIPDLVDLSPLKGKNLRVLGIGKTGVRDLQPLTGMQSLESLYVDYTRVADLAPLRTAHLRILRIHASAVRSLEPLRGQPLEELTLSLTQTASLDPIGDAPLVKLDLNHCGHLDLADLRSRHLRQLLARETVLDHLEVLAEMTELEIIILPKNLTDPGFLRKLPHLRKIEADASDKPLEKIKDAADFWREYDAARKAASPERN